jgi:hypothetical protein
MAKTTTARPASEFALLPMQWAYLLPARIDGPVSEQHRTRARFRVVLQCSRALSNDWGETREAIEAYCVAVGLVIYEWNDLHEKLARLFALVRGGDRQETLAEWYAIRSDTRQREKLRCAMTETTSDRWKKSPRARRSKMAARSCRQAR